MPAAISFSRDSEGKEQRLREWRAKNGIKTDEDREQHYGPPENRDRVRTHHNNEHRINRKAAMRHGHQIIAGLDSNESATQTGQRGNELITLAKQTGATTILIPTLRRLGVGEAQTQLRKQLEQAGLQIIITNPAYDAQNAILQSNPGPARDHELWKIAGADEYEWSVARERLIRSHHNYWETPDGKAALQFVAERPHLTLRQLGKALQFRRIATPRGRTDAWYPTSVDRIRKHLAKTGESIEEASIRAGGLGVADAG